MEQVWHGSSFCFCIVAAALTPPGALAFTEARDNDSVLTEVIVTATRASARLRDVPPQTTVVTRVQLDAAPERTLDQLPRKLCHERL